ncbi:hypothetical protein LB505_011547 [Fusarium chuoi]|nr:hypothetical protein LB505_011547 [Fusarium chuoi]
MLELVPGLSLGGLDSALDSFAVVLSLRNTVIDRPPSTFGNVVTLFCLPHVVSRHLRSTQSTDK